MYVCVRGYLWCVSRCVLTLGDPGGQDVLCRSTGVRQNECVPVSVSEPEMCVPMPASECASPTICVCVCVCVHQS